MCHKSLNSSRVLNTIQAGSLCFYLPLKNKQVAQLWQRDCAKLDTFSINVRRYSQNHAQNWIFGPPCYCPQDRASIAASRGNKMMMMMMMMMKASKLLSSNI